MIKSFGLGIAALIAVLVIALIIGAMSVFGVGWFNRATADFRGQTDAIEQTRADADFRIGSYQMFFDLCSEVQALEDRVTIFEQRVESETGTIKESEARTNLDAAKAMRAQKIRDYNARASRGFTEGQFRDSSLPYSLDINNMETTCSV